MSWPVIPVLLLTVISAIGSVARQAIQCPPEHGSATCWVDTQRYEIAFPYTREEVLLMELWLNRTVQALSMDHPDLILRDDDIRVRLDGHIQGPLLDEIAAMFKVVNRGLRVHLYAFYDDCNQCRVPGTPACTLMLCDAEWQVFMFIGRRHPFAGRFKVPVLAFDWTEGQMRQRWRRRLKADAFPFPEDDGEEEEARPPSYNPWPLIA